MVDTSLGSLELVESREDKRFGRLLDEAVDGIPFLVDGTPQVHLTIDTSPNLAQVTEKGRVGYGAGQVQPERICRPTLVALPDKAAKLAIGD